MRSKRMNIWGKPQSPTQRHDNLPSVTPRVQLPQFKTTEEVMKERRKEQHEEPDQARPEQDPHITVPKPPRRNASKKRRSYSISICVSEEEEGLLRKAASNEGMTFSGWARQHLFKAANKKIPKRHK